MQLFSKQEENSRCCLQMIRYTCVIDVDKKKKKKMDEQTMTGSLFKTRLDVNHQWLAIPRTSNWDHRLMHGSMKISICWPNLIWMEWILKKKLKIHYVTWIGAHPQAANFNKGKFAQKKSLNKLTLEKVWVRIFNWINTALSSFF